MDLEASDLDFWIERGMEIAERERQRKRNT